MIEIKTNQAYADAIERAHKERGEAFADLFHTIWITFHPSRTSSATNT